MTKDHDFAEGMALLDRAAGAFNSADATARASLNHYPHVRITGPRVTIWLSPEEYERDTTAEKLRSIGKLPQFPGWTSTRWVRRDLVQRSVESMHLAVEAERLDGEGRVLATFESLWILTKKDGRWGVQARSSFVGIADGGAY